MNVQCGKDTAESSYNYVMLIRTVREYTHRIITFVTTSMLA